MSIHYKHRYILSSKSNCDDACGIISPYRHPQNFRILSQKKQTLCCIKKFLEADIKLQHEIADSIENTTHNILVKWCHMKNKGICDICNEWNHEHNNECINHPTNMRRNASDYIDCNNELEIFPFGVNGLIRQYLFL